MSEDKNYRGELVKIIVKTYLLESLFDTTDKLKTDLQNELNSNLKFKVEVLSIQNESGRLSGIISYEMVDGYLDDIEFTMISNFVKI